MNKQELAANIWTMANALRKNIKASEYKDYILGFMFYKYLSDTEIDFVNANGGTIEDLHDDSPENVKFFQDKLGYFIGYNDLFKSWRDLGIKLGAKTVSSAIEAFYGNLNEKYARCFYVYNKTVDKHFGVFDALDAGLSKLGENAGSRDKAVRDIVNLVGKIPPTSEEYDVLGYIYEYLIKQFSSEAKKDGAFYTPHELTQLMARIVVERLRGRDSLKVYDPCLGTAGLMINIGQEAKKYIDPNNIKYYGQELITETSNLAKMNLFMKQVPVQNMIIRNADSLDADWPYFDEYTEYSPLFVDAAIANPPYSAAWAPNEHVTDERFRAYGLAPAGKADYAFLLHCLYHIKPDGIMAIVLPHGVLFRGGPEGEIRKNLIDAHNIETIIGMPANLFFSTGIPVIVMILSKNRSADDVLFIDASKCFAKEKTQSVLRDADIQRIFDAVQARMDIPHFAHLASLDEIKRNDYNLNIPRYVSSDISPIPFDPYSVMTGEISKEELARFDAEWAQFPQLKAKLFAEQNDGYSVFACDDIKAVVNADDDVNAYKQAHYADAGAFREHLVETLIHSDTSAETGEALKNAIMDAFSNDPLIDKYAAYQTFASHWREINADLMRIRVKRKDVCRETEEIVETKKNKNGEYEDSVKGRRGTIIPIDLVKSVFFADDFARMNELQKKADAAAAEYADPSDLDEDAKNVIMKENDDEKIDAKKLKKAIKDGSFDDETTERMKNIQSAMDAEKGLNKQIKAIKKSLDERAENKLHALTDEEIDNLLIRKWIDPLADGIAHLADNAISAFVSDLEALRKKYSDPLASLSDAETQTNKALTDMMSHLTGNVTDKKAISMMVEELK